MLGLYVFGSDVSDGNIYVLPKIEKCFREPEPCLIRYMCIYIYIYRSTLNPFIFSAYLKMHANVWRTHQTTTDVPHVD